jgi:hypothetical protein
VGRTSESAQARDVLRGEEESRQANFLELFFDLVLVFALIGVVSRVVPDLLSDRRPPDHRRFACRSRADRCWMISDHHDLP